MQHTFNAAEAIDATIQLAMGELTITADDVGLVTVDITPTQPDRAADVRAAENTAVVFAGTKLEVTQPREGMLSNWVNKSWSIDVQIRVPRGSRLAVKSSYGNIRVHGSMGESTLTTAYGDITADDIAGLTAKTSHGELRVEQTRATSSLTGSSVFLGEVHGSATVKCAHGNITAGLVAGTLTAASGTGNIDIRTLTGEVDANAGHGRIQLRDAVSGTARLAAGYSPIEVGIRSGTLAWLDLEARNGTVRNELDTADPEAGNDDGAADRVKVTARTNYGTIRAYRTEVPGVL